MAVLHDVPRDGAAYIAVQYLAMLCRVTAICVFSVDRDDVSSVHGAEPGLISGVRTGLKMGVKTHITGTVHVRSWVDAERTTISRAVRRAATNHAARAVDYQSTTPGAARILAHRSPLLLL
eukprot:639870-Pleurochrysis_carterae.AAC.3